MYLIKLISKKRNYFSIGKDYTKSISIIIHNDTLFSAICNNFRKIYGKEDLEDFLGQITELENNEGILFELSSCFHYIDIYKNDEYYDTIYFLPRPLIRFPLDTHSQAYLDENPKLFKKIQFISFEIVRKLQKGQNISLSQFHIIDGKYLVDEKDLENLGLEKFISQMENPDLKLEKINRAIRRKINIYEILDEQKVRINRIIQESEPFTWSKLKFRSSKYYVIERDNEINYELRPGFYFLFNYNGFTEDIINKVNASIKLIIDEGLGGKRSIGCGLFDDINVTELDKDFEYFDIFEKKDNGYYTNLSLVYPSIDEIGNVKYFNLYGRSGFVFSFDNISKRFNDVKFIEEGAIFDKKIRGKLIQVASDEFVSEYHKVFKNGIGIYLNIGEVGVD